MTLGREFGSAAVEQRLTEIALLLRKRFPDYRWDPPERQSGGCTNRVHVMLEGRDISLCFTDRELISYSTLRRRPVIDHRMHEVLSRLLDK